MNIYVGNLPHSTTEQELIDLFKPYGNVTSGKIVTDRETGQSRGFGFIELEGGDGAEAIRKLSGSDFGGRPLVVNEARPRTEGGGGGGYNGRGNSGGGGNRRW